MLLNCGAVQDSLESPGLKGNQTSQSSKKSTLMFTERTDAEAEAPILWPADAKSQFTGKKTLILGKTEARRRKGQQRMRWLDSITDLMDTNLNKF